MNLNGKLGSVCTQIGVVGTYCSGHIEIMFYRWARRHARIHQLHGARGHVFVLPDLCRAPTVGSAVVEKVHYANADRKLIIS